MKSSAFAILALVALFSMPFACADSSQLGMQYATSTVLRDCAQKPLSITNRTEFLPFYSQAVDEANIAKILALAADLSTKDPAAVSSQQTYLQCGDYVLSGQNGTLYWRGVELTPPGYVRELDSRVIELEGQSGQASFTQQALQQRVSMLEEDVLSLRSDFATFQYASFGMMALILGLLVWQVFFSSRHEQGHHAEHHGIRHHVSKLLHKKRD